MLTRLCPEVEQWMILKCLEERGGWHHSIAVAIHVQQTTINHQIMSRVMDGIIIRDGIDPKMNTCCALCALDRRMTGPFGTFRR